MPLEIKTGKASFSSEHRGQVIIYQMMMSEVGQKVDNGLLLYLRFVFDFLITILVGVGVEIEEQSKYCMLLKFNCVRSKFCFCFSFSLSFVFVNLCLVILQTVVDYKPHFIA